MDADARGVTAQAANRRGPTVVSILNLKGGVGKTTVAALLARYASGKLGWLAGLPNLKVLAVDLDPQANLSQALMTEREYDQFMRRKDPSIVELFDGFRSATTDVPSPTPALARDVVKKISDNPNLDIIPSRFDFSDRLIGSIGTDKKVLARFIAEEMAHKDLIIIDCAPTESILTLTAYRASRYVLIPVRTEFFATIGFPLMKQSLDSHRVKNPSCQIDVCGVILQDSRTRHAPLAAGSRGPLRDILSQAEYYGWPVLENWLDHSAGYPKWAKDPYATHLGNAERDWPPLAQEILRSIGLGG